MLGSLHTAAKATGAGREPHQNPPRPWRLDTRQSALCRTAVRRRGGVRISASKATIMISRRLPDGRVYVWRAVEQSRRNDDSRAISKGGPEAERASVNAN